MDSNNVSVYLVDWREIVIKTMDYEDFLRITVELIHARAVKLPNADHTVFFDERGKRKIPADVETQYDKCVNFMAECGYGIGEDILKHYGWMYPYLDDDNEVKFHTTAPKPRQIISWASYIDQKKRFEEGGSITQPPKLKEYHLKAVGSEN